jgi:AraC-like DNA-binding protein
LKKADIVPREHARVAAKADWSAPPYRLRYREYRPPAQLAHHVECFWRRERWRPPSLDLGVLPDGRIDLIWSSRGEMLVIGPQSRPLGRPLPPDVVVVAVRFRPGVAPSLLRVSADEFVDAHIPLEAFDTRAAMSLLHELATIEDAAAAPALIARAIARQISSRCSADPVVQRAAALLESPNARVERVASALTISERHLQRRFRKDVGYGPKTLHRVLRFQRLLAALRLDDEQPDGLARIASAVGYSDQAHLTRETRELSGLSPVRLARALDVLESEGATGVFKTGQRAAAT